MTIKNHASIFSGIGGAELAAQWMRWKNVFHCEIQEFQRKVLEYWFPDSISYEDITKTDFSEWRGKVDILTAGFPCQPYSVAGKRLGAEDDRALWPEMLRAIREIQPTWVVGENVTGILSMVQPGKEIKVGHTDDLFDENFIYRTGQQFTIDVICEDIERAGYSVQPLVIPACAVGAPHKRDRVWIVANRTDARAESVQQGGQDGVCRPNVASDTNGNRQRQRENKQIIEQKCSRPANTCNDVKNGPIANAQFSGGEEMVNDVQSEVADGTWTDGDGLLGTSSNAKSTGSTGQLLGQQTQIQSDRQDRRICKPDFADFPTQSPVCSRDDGLPFDVADLTIPFPQWRSKSIEALGNAWVPQVAYEIFKAIENYGKS